MGSMLTEFLKGTVLTKINVAEKWKQSKAYDLGKGRIGFILHFNGAWLLLCTLQNNVLAVHHITL
jgi:hypothetical protein